MRQTQLELFREVATAKQISRRSDPSTSQEAAIKLVTSRRLNGQALQVLRLLVSHGGLTSIELARIGGLCRVLVARRLPDLRRRGLAQNIGDRIDPVSGSRGVCWYATGAGRAELGQVIPK